MAVLLVHLAATLYMTGLIWFVQLVHYPLMARVGAAGFGDYELHHQRRTGWAVGPAMLTEAATAAWLAVRPTPPFDPALAWAGLGMVGLIWLSTAAVQVPLHRKLEAGFDGPLIAKLVNTNWLRTVLWTGRSVLLLIAISPG